MATSTTCNEDSVLSDNSEPQFDAVIIGAGAAGTSCAIHAKMNGLKVVLIERDKLGGVWHNTGATPSKALRASAEIYHLIKRSKDYGIDSQINFVSPSKVFERAREISNQARQKLKQKLDEFKVPLIYGEAMIVDNHSVKVNDKLLKAHNIVIATGSQPKILDHNNNSKIKNLILTSENIFNIDQVPKTLAILGGGVIGCEFAGIFPMLDTKVTLVEPKERILSAFDPEISEFLIERFKKRGIEVLVNAKEVKITENGLQINGREHFYDKVLLAIGRNYVFPKGIEKLNLTLTKYNTIQTNEYLQANHNIYAIGDVASGMVAHCAIEHGRIAALNIAGKKTPFRNVIPHVIYSSPEIAMIGSTIIKEEEKDKKFSKKIIFKENLRAQIESRASGFAKITYDQNHNLCGALLACQRAGEIIGYFTIAMQHNLTIEDLKKVVLPYPTYSEIVRQLINDF
ncbi:MAG: NAD(P)/FAD-dependent oxidoreductase [Candidatus Micrarchaeota archaeon]|nr:NAD(P)/FAD-dependent oxidoreductase [Candidatus Micrarchaeota archaeon]